MRDCFFFAILRPPKINDDYTECPEKWGQFREPDPTFYIDAMMRHVDIVRYYRKCGYLNNVATNLDSLVEKWDGRKAKKIFRETFVSTSSLQRLGYLLDEVLGHEKPDNYVENALKERKVFPVDLDPTFKTKSDEINNKWKIKVNTKVEPD
ncbi:MAG: type IV toxin-antitoxin system AbiEi family antitoxin [Oligoflexus sp.]